MRRGGKEALITSGLIIATGAGILAARDVDAKIDQRDAIIHTTVQNDLEAQAGTMLSQDIITQENSSAGDRTFYYHPELIGSKNPTSGFVAPQSEITLFEQKLAPNQSLQESLSEDAIDFHGISLSRVALERIFTGVTVITALTAFQSVAGTAVSIYELNQGRRQTQPLIPSA